MIQNSSLLDKLIKGTSNTLIFCDFDGTLVSPDSKVFLDILANLRFKKLLQNYGVPYGIVTGRVRWGRLEKFLVTLVGLPQPDFVVCGAGTKIYVRNVEGNLIRDKEWEAVLSKKWSKSTVYKSIKEVIQDKDWLHDMPEDNKLVIRFRVDSVPVEEIRKLMRNITSKVRDVKVLITEKLQLPNTVTHFSGEIIILPLNAGKEGATEYLLKTISTIRKDSLHVYLAGDASIDIPFLTFQYSNKNLTFHRYGGNLTPLAKQGLAKEPSIYILSERAPESLVGVLEKDIKKNSVESPRNSPLRAVLNVFAVLLDKVYPLSWSPNMISYHGLASVQKGVTMLYTNKDLSIVDFVIGLGYYLVGYSADIFDGIRSRFNPGNDSIHGALIDVYCDRYKEFYQIYVRAQYRKERNNDQQELFNTLDTALSAFLPSIARAAVEVEGKVVEEWDPMGGSMLSRSILLFKSLVCDTVGFHTTSYQIDKEVLKRNLATYNNRKKNLSFTQLTVAKEGVASLERFLLLVDLYQEAVTIIQESCEEYKNSKSINKELLSINTAVLRKKYQIKDAGFSLRSSLDRYDICS